MMSKLNTDQLHADFQNLAKGLCSETKNLKKLLLCNLL